MCTDTDWREFIRKAIENEASDIHLTVEQRPYMRCLGILQPMDSHPLTELFMEEICSLILNDCQREKLSREREIDLSWTFEERRFRVHAYYQKGWPALAFRLLPERIPSLSELGAPDIWQKMKEIVQGFILVTGRTGSGKSTTLAAFIEELNREKSYHIVTLEDPIEFLYRADRSFISQRELGSDFLTFPGALKNALREMPDIILVGEIRDPDTMQMALEAASTGIFVLGTLHTKGAAETAMRVESLFPLRQRDAVRDRFADVFTGIFSQCLLPSVSGSRVCATEVLLATPASRNLIRQGKYHQLASVMMSSPDMNTMEQSLDLLIRQRKISAV